MPDIQRFFSLTFCNIHLHPAHC